AHRPPTTQKERRYRDDYLKRWGQLPPGEYPLTDDQEGALNHYRAVTGFDLRMNGLPVPQTKEELQYAYRFFDKHRTPPAAYPKDEREEREIDSYIENYGLDPRTTYSQGIRAWSIWLHVTDPGWIRVLHTAVCVVTLLFTIGFCTRVTSVLTWLGAISYIHRNPYMLFGVDTMMNILLIYLMIGPSGAALSVDRWLARWWSQNKPRTINWWRGLWGKEPLDLRPEPHAKAKPASGKSDPAKPEPSVSANVAIRLTQIHVCIIYLVAGLAKLLGRTWWEGPAIWGTLACFEFAPMETPIYQFVLRTLGQNRLVFELFLTIGTYFTLFFEIGYAFLIWRPSTRWVMLSMAIVLHGFIGLFMGLQTFSLMMLVMDMTLWREREGNGARSGREWNPNPRSEPRPPAEQVETEPILSTESAAAIRHAVKEPSKAIKKKSG